MYTELALALLGGAALGASQVTQVQGPAPPPVLLTTTKSGVLPVLPTPFSGIQTEEGALLDQGPVNGSFVGLNGPAVAQTNMPGTTYTATLPRTLFNPYAGGNITGTVTATGSSQGVQFTINLSGLPPANYGPFGYHIHTLPVPADGNCTSTMSHLDPTNRGEYFMCDPAQAQNCQAGDLAGKHGKITGNTFTASYTERYLSTDPASPYYFGGVSIVFHTSNTTRLTCANFVQSNQGGGGGSSGGGGSGTTSSGSAGGGCPVPSTTGGGGSGGVSTGTATVTSTAAATTTSQGTGTSTRPTPSTVPSNGATRLLAGGAGGLVIGFVFALFL